jgi:hypothetical protein
MQRSGLFDWMRSVRSRRVIAGAVVTVVTVAIIGVVLLATTPIGCGPAKAIGVKSIAGQCGRPVAALTPGIQSPSPLSTAVVSLSPTASFPSPTPLPDFSPSPVPSGTVPDTGPATGAYPPFIPSATSPGGVAIPGVNLICRLPVFAGPPGSGGFIVFPGGTFIADPKSAVALPTPTPGAPSPPPNAYGPPPSSLSYDAAFSKWLPVPSFQVSPDGSRYAFASASSIYVVDVASGSLSEIGDGQAWTIVSVQAAGVYASQPSKGGLWRVPFTGAPVQITSAGFWQAASSKAAYGTVTSAVPQGATNSIIRLDLQTGAVTNWFTRPDTITTIIGLNTNGLPIMSVSYFQGAVVTEIWLSTGPGAAIPITGSGSGMYISGSPVADRNGIWFSGTYTTGTYYNTVSFSGFALYVPGRGMYWMSNLSAQLGGGCAQP